MPSAIRKFGQGYWTRVMSVVGFGLVGVLGAIWIWRMLETVNVGFPAIYLASGASALFLALVGALIWWFVGWNLRTVDFLVATEGEMKKVNWSTRHELVGSTVVVIAVVVVISLFCWMFDFIFSTLFVWLKVLDMRS
jgi:preprotein translocase subunit SecE